MILPWLRGFLSFEEIPLTWTLVGINILFFLVTSSLPSEVPALSTHDLKWAGRLYSEFINEEAPVDSSMQVLKGGQAMQDEKFLDHLENIRFVPGDQVGFEIFREHARDFRAQIENRPVNVFGLQSGRNRPMTWITYQFMHSGVWHILGNMLMLLLFAGALEKLAGPYQVVGIYLLGGIAGAALFLALSPSSTAPMVGASASLSAVMAYYAVFEKKQRVRFFFFLSPSKGYWGDIYLPTLLIFPLFFVDDVSSYLSTAKEIGAGIAYAAHMGGAAFGILLALLGRYLCAKHPQWEQILYASYSRSQPEAQ